MTIGELLPVRIDHFQEAIALRLEDGDAGKRPKLAWKTLEPQIVGGLRGALDVDVFACAAQAWCRARELHEYAAGGEHPPQEHAVVFLGEHSFTWQAHPVLTVIVGPVTLKPCRLTLTLKGHVEAAELLIHNGRIQELRSGECSATVQLSYGEVPLHKELATKKIPLPGRHAFAAPGVRIR